jgi:hypothetical protein
MLYTATSQCHDPIPLRRMGFADGRSTLHNLHSRCRSRSSTHPVSGRILLCKVCRGYRPLALAAAGVAALIPGFIDVKYKGLIRAGGALAVFVVVFFLPPAALVTSSAAKPTDPFKIVIINDQGGQLRADTFTFPISDIMKKSKPSDFIGLLRQLPGQRDTVDSSTTFRLSEYPSAEGRIPLGAARG